MLCPERSAFNAYSLLCALMVFAGGGCGLNKQTQNDSSGSASIAVRVQNLSAPHTASTVPKRRRLSESIH
jgi:hypothetical protein